VEYQHPVAGEVKTTGSPIRVDGSPARAGSMPATLGQHTRGLLRELGVDADTIEQMVVAGTAIVS
jgi:crotonobetainyl-CoA:carnitine CoA-transferase CaiB-like acyl-CoA transferase